MIIGYPETYGLNRRGHCGHCNAARGLASASAWGEFCLECFRWRSYTGPPQAWGDGMNTVTVSDESVDRPPAGKPLI